MRQKFVFVLPVALAIMAGAGLFAYETVREDGAEPAGKPLVGLVRIGASFQLIDQRGRTFSDADLRGHPALIYFGYTQCPDICPMALLKLSEALDDLGPDGAAIQPIFITVDPARDTPEALAEYVANFHPRLIGLTGPRNQIVAVERAFAVYAKAADTAETSADYLIDHTAAVFLVGADGTIRATIPQGASADDMAERIRDHL